MSPKRLDDYEKVVGREVIEELHLVAGYLRGTKMLHVNSTRLGGGVAEILNQMVPLLEDLGIDCKWLVIKGSNNFFQVTKQLHNALQGKPVEITSGMEQVYQEHTVLNADSLDLEGDFVIIHDPQPAGLITHRPKETSNWVWRCHIDLSSPHPEAWEFLQKYVVKYDASIFSMPAFSQELPHGQYLIEPSIDPLSDKNRDLDPAFISGVLEQYGIDPEKPIITQVSRFDYMKDPLGVIQAFRQVKKRENCQLVLAGGSATDDPEGSEVLEKVKAQADHDPDIHVLELPPDSDLEINALQRASTIILQKSLKEGFGLTVTEAMWKGKPVLGGAVGGIRRQIIHGFTGFLVRSIEGTAFRIRQLLHDPGLRKRMGENGRAHVQANYLITRHLKDYLLLMLAVQRPQEDIVNFFFSP